VATDRYDAALQFWEEVAGRIAEPEADEPYESLGRLPSMALALQRTGAGTPPRVHLDVETDDVPAEVDRLVGLGATVTLRFDDYVVLADPAGHPFCVVPVQTGPDFDAAAHSWDS
jgi:hypothetical protein